jgi:hypothetical protein
MKKRALCLFLLAIFFVEVCADAHSKKHAISFSGGDRFGDRLLAYAQARYLSYITSIPFLYHSFPYSHLLTIENDAISYDDQASNYSDIFHICSAHSFSQFLCRIREPSTPPTLFIVDYFPSDISEWDTDKSRSLALNIPWQEPQFAHYLYQTLSPRIPIPDFRVGDRLNIAVHVRTLSGTDTAETSFYALPLKHPTWDYHKRQIKRVYEWNLRRPMHVFLFTDSNNPRHVYEEFSNSFLNCDITFGIQYLDQPDVNYVVQDFFAMQKFEVLIATQSNFSIMAARIGLPDMFIVPVHAQGVYPNSRIDRVQVTSKKSSWFPYELNLILKDTIE